MTSRRRISKDLVSEVMFAADLRCCMCESGAGLLPPRLHGGQVHHLDGNHANNTKDNLVWLCLEHHEQAGTRGKAVRHLSADVIRRYRNMLENHIRRHRGMQRLQESKPRDRSAFAEALDAMVVLDIAKLGHRAGDDWPNIYETLSGFSAYPDSIGVPARQAIMEYAEAIARRTRSDMPAGVAKRLRDVAIETSELYFLGDRLTGRELKTTTFLRESAAEVGHSLVYDGALRLGSLGIVDAGAEVLWRVLAVATLSKNRVLRKAAMDGFAGGFDGAARGEQPDATTLLTIYRDCGLRGELSHPSFPESILIRRDAEAREERRLANR
jgi:hypothetical protein